MDAIEKGGEKVGNTTPDTQPSADNNEQTEDKKMSTVYLERNGGHLEYFICKLPDDDKTVSVENNVIAREAFKNASGVECVSLEKCEAVEEYAFEDCGELKIVEWRKSKKESKEKSNGADKAASIKGIEIAKVTKLTIQHAAFKNCSKLQTVILPNATEENTTGKITIEKEAFAGCGDLRTVVFNKAKEIDISDDAFIGCQNVTFLCEKSSTVERYAREHGFRIVSF